MLTSRWLGFPIMVLHAGHGAVDHHRRGQRPLATARARCSLDTVYTGAAQSWRMRSALPWWLDGFLVDGMYWRRPGWSRVMLPPMAIFFPLFTLLEDFGYLPRVAFNLDRLFAKAGAHGKQALTMAWASAATRPAWSPPG